MSWLARALSIFGHPLLIMPCAMVLLAALRDPEPRDAFFAVAGFLAFAVIVMGWSWWKVRRGHWRHVDASQPAERQALNRFLLVAIAISAALAWFVFAQYAFGLGLALSAALIVLAAVTTRWCTLSLHVAFAAYAAVLLSPLGTVAVAIGALLTCAIAWSRLHLGRHRPRDLVVGATSGSLAGLLFWQVGRHWSIAV